MQFGMPSLIEAPDLRACFGIAQRLGLQFIELNMNLPEYQLDAFDEPLARALIDQTGIFITLHLDENLSPCDFNPLVAEAWQDTALRAIELAARLDCPVVNMHLASGVYFTLPDRKEYLFERYRARYLADLARFRDRCAAAASAGVTICVENCGGFKPFQLAGIGLLLERPCFGLTFDVGHDHARHADEPFIRAHMDRLKHMHLHDANAQRSHMALGDGEIDFARMLAIARKAGCRVVIETKSIEGLERSAARVRETA